MTSETRALQEHLKNYLFFSCFFSSLSVIVCLNICIHSILPKMYTFAASIKRVYNDKITFMILYFFVLDNY